MADTNNLISTAEKVKAFAMGFVGAGIFSMGTTYFSEQAEYRIPRILWPVYELSGNIGLAIGMILLGSLLVFYAYRKFISNGGKAIYLLIFLVVAILGSYAIIFSTGKKSTSINDVRESLEENQKKTEKEITNSDRPDLEGELANNYLDQLEALKIKYEKAVNQKDKTKIDECENEYLNLVSVEFGKVAKEIGAKPEYRDFALYNAKVLNEIQVSRTK
ncbi:MFS transporter [Chryseobacterium sp. FH1]|uniref:MFS transporter n=1 Tax=Chryseobacterium sp. FH1 TaxID=1233951 RepID=UPI0004E29E53|nr:MFS transporter [Chryseobacterium sp. FH1]KFC24349.1 hypothetical protein IO90_03355 [Chryseobacterium sp. FH1]